MKRVVFSYLVVVVLTVLTTLSSCSSGMSTMKGTTYFNGNVKKKPMSFLTENVGVLEFEKDNKVRICFPYAIDAQEMEKSFDNKSVRVNSEWWIVGEYERIGSTITILFKLNEHQEEIFGLEYQVKDNGKTLLGEKGGRFDKIDRPKK